MSRRFQIRADFRERLRGVLPAAGAPAKKIKVKRYTFYLKNKALMYCSPNATKEQQNETFYFYQDSIRPGICQRKKENFQGGSFQPYFPMRRKIRPRPGRQRFTKQQRPKNRELQKKTLWNHRLTHALQNLSGAGGPFPKSLTKAGGRRRPPAAWWRAKRQRARRGCRRSDAPAAALPPARRSAPAAG